MHKIDGPGATPTNEFTEGDPSQGVVATVVKDDWLNALQNELVNIAQATGQALDKGKTDQVKTTILELIKGVYSPGDISVRAVTSVSSGWLECDGSALSRSTYADLFAAIATTYGTGDGSTTFNLPDYRGEFLRGWDNGRGIDSGRSIGQYQVGAIEYHNHMLPTGSGALDSSSKSWGIADVYWQEILGAMNVTPTGGETAVTHYQGADGSSTHTSAIKGSYATETRPRNIAVMFCIRY